MTDTSSSCSLRHQHQSLSQRQQFITGINNHHRAFLVGDWRSGRARSSAGAGCVARNSGGFDVVSFPLCCRCRDLLDWHWLFLKLIESMKSLAWKLFPTWSAVLLNNVWQLQHYKQVTQVVLSCYRGNRGYSLRGYIFLDHIAHWKMMCSPSLLTFTSPAPRTRYSLLQLVDWGTSINKGDKHTNHYTTRVIYQQTEHL